MRISDWSSDVCSSDLFTLRFVPAREDLATPASWGSPISTRAAIEAMPPGVVAVVDAMGITDAGIFGDILCARMARRGVAALVTDGVVRDAAGGRSAEHTTALQSPMRISYALSCLQ